MKKLSASACLCVGTFAISTLALVAGSASAQGMGGQTMAAQDWTGAYVTGFLGSNKAQSHDNTLSFDTNLDGKYGDTVNTYGHTDAFAPGFCKGAPQGMTPADGCHSENSKFGGGVRVGYDWQSDHLVYGVLGEISGTKLTDSVTGFSSEPNTYTFTRKVTSIAALRGRLGYAVDGGWLVYGTAGFASANLHRTFTTTNAQNSFTADKAKDSNGVQYGIGVEKKFTTNWTVGLEYLHTSLDDKGGSVLAGPGGTLPTNPFLLANANGTDIRRQGDKFKADSLFVTVGYRFGAM